MTKIIKGYNNNNNNCNGRLQLQEAHRHRSRANEIHHVSRLALSADDVAWSKVLHAQQDDQRSNELGLLIRKKWNLA